MTKKAHIINPTEVPEIGAKALALCGKEFKVTEFWDDVPRDKPICRDCVDLALTAMTEADRIVGSARARVNLLETMVSRMQDVLNPAALLLDEFSTDADEFDEKREAKKAAKAEKKKAKQTCTCTWTDAETSFTNPDCPIHGGDAEPTDDDTPVAPDGDAEGNPL